MYGYSNPYSRATFHCNSRKCENLKNTRIPPFYRGHDSSNLIISSLNALFCVITVTHEVSDAACTWLSIYDLCNPSTWALFNSCSAKPLSPAISGLINSSHNPADCVSLVSSEGSPQSLSASDVLGES